MKKIRLAIGSGLLLGMVAATVLIAGGAGASHGGPGFKTDKPEYLVPTAPGVITDAILSTGDVIGDPDTGYQMSGIPDGLGAYSPRKGRRGEFVVVMNHELGKSFPGRPTGVDTRISRLEIDAGTRSVHEAEYLFTGREGFERFCSSTLAIIFGRPFYFTGEEANDFGGVSAGHDGSSIVLDPDTGMWRETPHFGKLQHENVVPLRLSKWVFLTSEDDFRPGPSYLYAYIANDFNRALRGVSGSLYVWKSENPAKNQNSAVVEGESIPGRFVPIPQAENTTSASLKAASGARDAFRFDRLEDIAVRPGFKGQTYIADTGKAPSGQPTARGRIYQFDINPRNPTRATLKMILNGDGGDDIVNPDNMDASESVLVIQEDRESAFRGEPSRVLTYRFGDNSDTITTVAQVAKPETASRFNWESSGVIDARDFLGRHWWLLDVQAHDQDAPQPGVTLAPNTGEGEDGQLLAIKIPGSQGGGGHDDDDDDDDDD